MHQPVSRLQPELRHQTVHQPELLHLHQIVPQPELLHLHQTVRQADLLLRHVLRHQTILPHLLPDQIILHLLPNQVHPVPEAIVEVREAVAAEEDDNQMYFIDYTKNKFKDIL